MAQPIDDSYTDGVYYDAETGDFVTFKHGHSNGRNQVVICDTDGDPLDTIPVEDFYAEDFYPVPEEDVEDPVDTLEAFIGVKASEHQPFDAGLEYAIQHTEIVESDD